MLNETIVAGFTGVSPPMPTPYSPKKKAIETEENSKKDDLINVEQVVQSKPGSCDEVLSPLQMQSKPADTQKNVKPKCIEMPPILPPKSTTEQKKEKSHNKTYCNDWVMKNVNNSVSLIQSDFENAANDKTATTLIDVTSVSRNAQPL